MTRFERWFVARVLRREVRQGYDHDKRIARLYYMIREAAGNEFTEDNAPTLSAFLSEQSLRAARSRLHSRLRGAPIAPAAIPALTDEDVRTEVVRESARCKGLRV